MYDEGLSRYLDNLGKTNLMSPEDEVLRATEIARLKRNYWKALLSHPPIVGSIVQAVLELAANAQPNPAPMLRELVALAEGLHRRSSSRRETDYEAVLEAATDALSRSDVHGDVADVLWADLDLMVSGFDRASHLKIRREAVDWEQARPWLQRVRRAGDGWRFARNAFVQANLRLVVKIAHRHNKGQLPLEDLIQEGNLGLMTAVERFDPTRGFRFSTYSAWWIRHNITRAIAKRGRTVRLPVYMKTLHAKAARVRRDALCNVGREPSLEEIAVTLGVSVKKLERVEQAMAQHSVSLDGSHDEDGYPLEETVADEGGDLPWANLDDGVVRHALVRAMRVLDPMELDILRKRFGLEEHEELTLREVGEQYGLSRERIRQMQVRALSKLRAAMETNGVLEAP